MKITVTNHTNQYLLGGQTALYCLATKLNMYREHHLVSWIICPDIWDSKPPPLSSDELFAIKSIQAFTNALCSLRSSGRTENVLVCTISKLDQIQPIRALGNISDETDRIFTKETDKSQRNTSIQSEDSDRLLKSPPEDVEVSNHESSHTARYTNVNQKVFTTRDRKKNMFEDAQPITSQYANHANLMHIKIVARGRTFEPQSVWPITD